jgi:hypothetical protein
MSTAMWSYSLNADTCIGDFAAEVQKDSPSLGSGRGDFEKICGAFKITPCPQITFTESSLKIMNCIIDLSNWRAALLACVTINSPVREIVVHGCALTKTHILDTATALEKIGTIVTVKFDYITDRSGECLSTDFFRPLFAAPSLMEYLSLKGNSLTDEFMVDNAKIISENLTLKALNLSSNVISDTGFSKILHLLPHSISLKFVSMSQNIIEGGSFGDLAALMTGRPITADDDTLMKSIAKAVVDRNKILKDINKKRKKSGYPEFVELAAPTDRVVKVGPTSLLVHRSLASVDLSRNPVSTDNMKLLTDLLVEKTPLLRDSGLTETATECLFIGLSDSASLNLIGGYHISDENQFSLKLITKSKFHIDDMLVASAV